MHVKTQPTLLLQIKPNQLLLETALDFVKEKYGINSGSPDLHLINKEQTSIKIAQVRYLKQLLSYHPYQSQKTIICLLWADLATLAAQNALLKSLEEPPTHAQLILVTQYPDKLLPTILSRCVEVFTDDINQSSVTADDKNFPSIEEIFSATYSGAITTAQSYKDRAEARQLLNHLIKQLHSSPHYPTSESINALQTLIKTNQLLDQNINVQLALEACFFNIISNKKSS